MKRFLIFSLFLALAACGSDSTGPEVSYESIAGSYQGALVGNNNGILMESIFSLSIAQSSGDLSGTWSMTGTLTDGISTVPFQGTGNLSGTIQSGDNPSVNLRITNACSNYRADFSGVYDSPNRKLTINGPVDILDGCEVVLTYPSTIILTR